MDKIEEMVVGNIPEELKGMFKEMSAKIEERAKARKNSNVEAIREALNRPKLMDLKPGDSLKQKKLGEKYLYQSGRDGEAAVFVRYLDDYEIVLSQDTDLVKDLDIVVARFIDTRDGELVMSAVNSAYYEKVE